MTVAGKPNLVWKISGLTADNSYTYKLGFKSSSTTAVCFYAGGAEGGASMTVLAA